MLELTGSDIIAHTYKFASHLPSVLLDTLLNIPHILIGIRNRLLPAQPFRQPPRDLAPPAPTRPKAVSYTTSQASVQPQAQTSTASQAEADETLSDCEAESVSGDSGVDSSWVSLNGSQSDIRGDTTA